MINLFPDVVWCARYWHQLANVFYFDAIFADIRVVQYDGKTKHVGITTASLARRLFEALCAAHCGCATVLRVFAEFLQAPHCGCATVPASQPASQPVQPASQHASTPSPRASPPASQPASQPASRSPRQQLCLPAAYQLLAIPRHEFTELLAIPTGC